MWLATCEDEDGMWFDDPIAGNTEDEVSRVALETWADLPEGVAIVLWHCSSKGEVDRPVPQQQK